VIELRDSVFRFPQDNPDIGSEGVFLHNFWTTERIEPGASYRFSAGRAGETPSEAVVQIPPDFQAEVWLSQALLGGSDILRLTGLRHVAFAGATTYFFDACGPGAERISFPYTSADADLQQIVVVKRLQSRTGCGVPAVERRELRVVASGAPWPTGQTYSTSGLGVPDGSSSVTNSLGFLGGVLTRTIPYENCVIETVGPSSGHCILRYDAASATLRGTVKDASCGGGPVVRAAVVLREINPEQPGRPKLRTTVSNLAGTFEIGALEAGRRYRLTIRRLSPEGFDEFQEYADSLAPAPGERATRTAELRRVDPCPKQP
jgi:hypothetical protein